MGDNIFAETFPEPFVASEEWVPLFGDNTNCAPGDDIPSLAARRRVRAAAFVLTMERPARRRRGDLIEAPIGAKVFDGLGRASLARRVLDWLPSDTA